MAMVERGMTRKQVKRLLGKPANSITDRKFRSLYSGGFVSLGGRRNRNEAWVYRDVPAAGQLTFIYFQHRRVTEVMTQRAPD